MRNQRFAVLVGCVCPVLFCSLGSVEAVEVPVDFNAEIRPILSDNCYACHGPDGAERKANLRLDTYEGAIQDLGGYRAVLPGNALESELIRRITTEDEDDLMPPAKTGKTLSVEQIDKLKRWIDSGAQWDGHWAFQTVERPVLPEVRQADWPRNPIDYFALARLESEGLEPSLEADKETLIRRVSLDLTGLPPTPEETDAFLADDSLEAYEGLVDRLMASPRYGEQMARYWLDAARYGDTHGLHIDNERSIWPYRDWVVRAFNDNKPFDEFTVEQIGGDLLPRSDREQLVATGFNRCNVSTSEGGAIPEEFAMRYAVDRVETLSAVWMGLTAGCAACHDHKYDPISQKEFYQLYAFYNNLDENPMDGNALLPPPVVALSTPEEEIKLAEFDRQTELLDKVIRAAVLVVDYQDPGQADELEARELQEFVWVDDILPPGAKASGGGESWKLISNKEGPVFSGEKAVRRTGAEATQQYFTEASQPLLIGEGDRLFAHVFLDPDDPPQAVMLQFYTDGWKHRAFWGEDLIDFGKKNSSERRRLGDLPERGRWVRLEVPTRKVGLGSGAKVYGLALTQYGGTVTWDRAGLMTRQPQGQGGYRSQRLWESVQRDLKSPAIPKPLLPILRMEETERSPEQQRQLREYFLEYAYADTRIVFDPLHTRLESVKKERAEYDRNITRSLITRELAEPRETFVLKRGEYDNPGERVYAAVPAILPSFPANQPTNRLGLARWLVTADHPLTARVTVNRFWLQHFGVGIVKTAEDFGAQGDPPSHPELLNWLAAEFMSSGWDMKHLHRLIVMSSTYRQDSAVPEGLAGKDPENRLLAHGPRFRLDAEVIRDSVLYVSGLLVEAPGGRGVRPYQPSGIWEAVSYPTSTTANYAKDSGDALYRRSMYTFWKRTAPPPSLLAFDAPTRESCRVRRERTNTPLQALALLNDVQYVEAARHLAGRILREGGDCLNDRLNYGFRLATARYPDEREREILGRLYEEQLSRYSAAEDEAARLLQVGETPLDASLSVPDYAAWTLVANTLLNLSETITLN